LFPFAAHLACPMQCLKRLPKTAHATAARTNPAAARALSQPLTDRAIIRSDATTI
jgi:hypothetical protein